MQGYLPGRFFNSVAELSDPLGYRSMALLGEGWRCIDFCCCVTLPYGLIWFCLGVWELLLLSTTSEL